MTTTRGVTTIWNIARGYYDPANALPKGQKEDLFASGSAREKDSEEKSE
jgi:hypothetical protein